MLANNYFTNEWPTPGCSSCLSGSHPSSIWTRATYFEGSLAMWRINHDPAITNYATRWGTFTTGPYATGPRTPARTTSAPARNTSSCTSSTPRITNRITNIVANLNYWMYQQHHELIGGIILIAFTCRGRPLPRWPRFPAVRIPIMRTRCIPIGITPRAPSAPPTAFIISPTIFGAGTPTIWPTTRRRMAPLRNATGRAATAGFLPGWPEYWMCFPPATPISASI